MTRFSVIFFALALLAESSFGKRTPPATVEPVIHEGVRYIAPNDDGRRAHIEAWDVQTNRKLWDLTVFTNRIDPKLEEDVQWFFIDKLGVHDETLIVKSERGITYQIDLKTKAITQSEAACSAAPGVAAHRNEIPELIDKAIANNGQVPEGAAPVFQPTKPAPAATPQTKPNNGPAPETPSRPRLTQSPTPTPKP